MTSSTPASSLRSSWLADDGNNLSASEALGLIGVAVWGGALACMVVSDLLKARSTSERRSVHDRDWRQWQREIDADRSPERPL